MKKRQAFTLIEILIVLVIVAMLIGVLFKIYITISQITFRVELQKEVNEELLFITDTLQNLSNRNEIDYSEYNSNWSNLLFSSGGIANILYLSWEDGKVSVYGSGCTSGHCNLYMNKSDEEIQLTNDTIYFSDIKFKVIPFEKLDYYTYDSQCEEQRNAYVCRNNQWFWFMTTIYSTGYDSDRWTNNVYLNINQFFNN